MLGSARRVVVSKDATVIVDGGGTRRGHRRPGQAAQERDRGLESDWDREKLEERLAKAGRRVAVIKVGAATETALKGAQAPRRGCGVGAKAAVEEGIVAGGGSALVQTRAALAKLRESLSGDEALGVEVFARRCRHHCSGSPPTPARTARSW